MNELLSPRDWMPVSFGWSGNGPVVEWCDFAGADFTDPFFDHTITRLLHHPARNLIRPVTPVETLLRLSREVSGESGGIIFHLSRCGSTLVSQMLAAAPQHVVLSEPCPPDQLLTMRRRNPGIPDTTWADWLRALLRIMGRRRKSPQQRWFWKCDARHVLDLPFITLAFPEAPRVFIYRDPVEVLMAHRGLPARLMVPGAQVAGMESLHSPAETPPEEHISRVLAAFCQAALASRKELLFLNYRDVPHAAWPLLVRHFNLVLSPGECARAMAVAGRNAKHPGQKWQSDAGHRRAAASSADRAAVERHFAQLLPELERARAQSMTGHPLS